jgi:iron complex outermembrane receptor protein
VYAVIRHSICVLMLLLVVARAAIAQDLLMISGVVTTRADGMPVPGATVSVVGGDTSATTDASGSYTLQAPRARVPGNRIQLKVSALEPPAKLIDVAIDGATVTANVALTLEFSEQVTVGSRAAGTLAEKAVPVDVITHDQIVSAGYAETAQIIQSLNFPRPTISDSTDTVRPATLRGLGPDQVLVLINGKRRHQSALVHMNNSISRGSTGVDLNAIPVAAIDRIEVLRDGAAAQYGSDAIAGVINIVLRSGAGSPDVALNVGLSTGTFVGNRCTPNRPGFMTLVNLLPAVTGGIRVACGRCGYSRVHPAITLAA